ncbi:sel1 repeat family protein [Kitasatospora sp. NPDC049258]|uniref:tetratricopeptide repeat protein n=1 Tax=Kitasatospora sp. NPDC049258 TaxID=3155394 RepID=UPI0034146F1D
MELLDLSTITLVGPVRCRVCPDAWLDTRFGGDVVAAERTGVERDFIEAARRLSDYYKTSLAERRPLRWLARELQVAPTTVSNWLDGKSFPQQRDRFIRLINILRAAADDADLSRAARDSGVLDQEVWKKLYDAVARERADVVRESVGRAAAVAGLEERESKARYEALVDRPRPLKEWTPKQLGVHPAIPGLLSDRIAGNFVLPAYVEREHDRVLRQRLAVVASGAETALVVVRGESCTGKTRTAFEAVRACFPAWDLVFPKTPESLLAILAADVLTSGTVLWLNEAQNYLTGTAGEAAAAALRTQLERPGPVAIVMTLWPVHYRQLTATPSPGQEHRPNVRALLGSHLPVHVPDAFSTQAMNDLSARSKTDASLAAAEKASRSGAVAQTLAAGPELVDHYEQAGTAPACFGKAIITAAMDARRLGGGSLVSARFLETAAIGYLTQDQRREARPGWFADALDYARFKVKGVVAALDNAPDPEAMGALPDMFCLADYLDRHARTARYYSCPPASFWSASQRHAVTAAELQSLGGAARARGRYRTADGLYRKAIDLGRSSARMELGWLRQELGDSEGAERLHRHAVGTGNIVALADLAMLRERAGDQDEAEQLAMKAAFSGMGAPILELMWERLADPEEAERLAQQAAELGNLSLLVDLAGIWDRGGHRDDAERLYRQAADGQHPLALAEVARFRVEAGDLEEAERFAVRAADVGFSYPLLELAQLLERFGQKERAEQLARHAADSGDRYALVGLARMLRRLGNEQEAEALAVRISNAGQVSDLIDFVWLGGESWEAAEHLAKEAADAGDTKALTSLVRAWSRTGNKTGAEQLARQAADAGNREALVTLARAWEDEGDLESAQRMYRQAADAGDPFSLRELARLREEAGDGKGAELLYRQGADAGDSRAIEGLAKLWERAGERDRAMRLLASGLEADGSLSDPEWMTGRVGD